MWQPRDLHVRDCSVTLWVNDCHVSSCFLWPTYHVHSLRVRHVIGVLCTHVLKGTHAKFTAPQNLLVAADVRRATEHHHSRLSGTAEVRDCCCTAHAFANRVRRTLESTLRLSGPKPRNHIVVINDLEILEFQCRILDLSYPERRMEEANSQRAVLRSQLKPWCDTSSTSGGNEGVLA